MGLARRSVLIACRRWSSLFVVGLVGLIYRELRIANPLINFRTLKDRNFRSCCIIIFCAFGVLYANTTRLPGLLQSLFGYDATTSGLVLSPAGMFAIVMLLVVGILLSRGVDARYLMAAGLVTLGIGNYWMSQMNLEIGPWQVVWPRVVVIVGLSMIFAPLNVAAFIYIPQELRGAAVGLLALLRNEGGSVGTSVAQTVLERREQFHALRLNEKLDPPEPGLNQWFQQGQEFFLQQTGDCRCRGGWRSRRCKTCGSAGFVAGLLRRVLVFGGAVRGPGFPGSADAPLGGREREPTSRRSESAYCGVSLLVTLCIWLEARIESKICPTRKACV